MLKRAMLVVLLAASFAKADSIDVLGIHGAVGWGVFRPLGPTVGVNSFGELGLHAFATTLPEGFTSGTIIWNLTVNGVTYTQSVVSSTLAGFNSFFPHENGQCIGLNTSIGMLSGICATVGFFITPFEGALPAHLDVVFLDGKGGMTGDSNDFRLATVPEPETWALMFLGLMFVSLTLVRKKFLVNQRLRSVSLDNKLI